MDVEVSKIRQKNPAKLFFRHKASSFSSIWWTSSTDMQERNIIDSYSSHFIKFVFIITNQVACKYFSNIIHFPWWFRLEVLTGSLVQVSSSNTWFARTQTSINDNTCTMFTTHVWSSFKMLYGKAGDRWKIIHLLILYHFALLFQCPCSNKQALFDHSMFIPNLLNSLCEFTQRIGLLILHHLLGQ